MVNQGIGYVRVSTLDKTRQASPPRYGTATRFHVNATATHTASNVRLTHARRKNDSSDAIGSNQLYITSAISERSRHWGESQAYDCGISSVGGPFGYADWHGKTAKLCCLRGRVLLRGW
jgi:hypothetical protein